MEYENFPQTEILRDGRSIIVREMTIRDEARMVEFFQGLPLEDRLFLRNDVTKPEVVHRFVRETEDLVLALVVEFDGRIVASATIERGLYGWTRHVGEVRLVVARSMQRCGLATVLLRHLVRAAPGEGIEIVKAFVAGSKGGALRALESLGFNKEATLRRHVKDVTGRKHDLLILTNDVSHIWEKMEALNSDFSPVLGG
jgi:GNAT superfamily N-acetyltransferase